jgi:hypothetical protein
LSIGTSWPSGTLHLTDFVDQTAIFAGVFAGEEYFVSKTAAAVLAVLALSVCAIPMSAQLLPSGNLYAGVSYGQLTNVVNQQSYKGWNGSVEAFPFSRYRHLGLVLDASGFYRKDVTRITQYNAVAGPRLSVVYGKWRPFVHAMAGVRHLNSSGFVYNPLVIDGGGGIDYKLWFKNFSWRVQGDYMHTHYLSATQNDYRVSTGIVWRF